MTAALLTLAQLSLAGSAAFLALVLAGACVEGARKQRKVTPPAPAEPLFMPCYAPTLSLTARLRAPILADVTDATEPEAWDTIAGELRWRGVLRAARVAYVSNRRAA
jgi:hypothetical protein